MSSSEVQGCRRRGELLEGVARELLEIYGLVETLFALLLAAGKAIGVRRNVIREKSSEANVW